MEDRSAHDGEVDKAAVEAEEQQQEQEQLEHSHFELTILIPKPNFGKSTWAKSTVKAGQDLDNYIPLAFPTSGTDCIRDIKQTVAESPEGFWIGSHSFRRILLKEKSAAKEGEEPTVIIDGEPSEVFNEALDLAHVFPEESYKNLEVRRVLIAVATSYTDAEARSHLLRLRDASLGYLTALQAKRLYQPPPYDSSSLAIDAGLTLFPFVSGSNDGPTAEQEKPIVNGHGDAVNGHDGNKSSKRPKGKGKGAPPAPKPSKAAPSSFKRPDSSSAEWLTAPSDPLQVHLDRNIYLPSTSLPTSAFKHLALSVWNPPPAHLRLRGHFLYITVNTLEGENFQITASEKGFYINRSDNHHFDPSPRSNTSPSKSQAVQQTFHSIFDLLSAVSPQFLQRTEALVADSPTDFLEFFASAPLATCSPAAPWLVPPPTNVADGTRSQLAYLYTGSTSADTLPSARDWNEELTSMRELPQATNDDRLFRDRYAAKLFSDFQLAAMRAVPSIARGDVPPLNAIDPAEAKSYLVSNILFTQAQDSVDAFAHLGRDEAARVTAGKDLWAAKLLNDADIPKLNPIATAVVDYCGARWVAQAIPPGIFDRGLPGTDKEGAPADTSGEEAANKKASEAKKDTKKESTPAPAGLRAVYGPANTDKPQDGYVAEAVFEPLAKQIAQHFHLARHTVTDTKGRETELWTPADVHGIIAADGRAYIIDLFRLFPVDVNFLEQNISGKLYGQEEAVEATEADAYPHRVVLLRPELVELYHGTKAREWIEQQVKESTNKETSDAAAGDVKEITDGTEDKSFEKPESATSEEFVKVEKENNDEAEASASSTEPKKQTVIDVGNFKLAFNPDAFVDRPDKSQHTAEVADPSKDEDSTKAVRDASTYLRETAIPSLLRDVITDEIVPLDSAHLSTTLHKRGINIRYLGLIAEETKKPFPMPGGGQLSETAANEVAAFMANFRACLVRDMVARGAKHVLRRIISGLCNTELTEAISHFLNCLLGPASNAPNAINTSNPTAEWTRLQPESLRKEVVGEVRRRFRYSIPAAYFEDATNHSQLLREVALSSGIQLALRQYSFSASSALVNGTTSEEDESHTKQGSSGKKAKNAQTNGYVHASSVFTPEDILNLFPIPKKAPFRSAFVENLFEQGQVCYVRGQHEHGEAFVNDALGYYETIFGSVHPELGEAYRALANLYHRLAGQLSRRIQLFEASGALAKDEDRKRARAETGFADEEALKVAKAHYDAYCEQAIKLTRQAVIIAERTTGIDSHETLQCYSDLAIFESQVGNGDRALRCLQHAVALSNALYGDNHPEKAKAAFFAAQSVKKPNVSTVPFYKAAQTISSKAYGPNSIISANSAYQLGQSYIVDNNLAGSIPFFEEAIRIFETRLGKDSENAREATQLLAAVRQAMEQKERGELEKVQKLAKRLGSDSARAKELMSRMGGSTARKIPTAASSQAPGDSVQAVENRTGSRGHLAVDELVQFIEGKPTAASKASKNRKKTAKKQ